MLACPSQAARLLSKMHFPTTSSVAKWLFSALLITSSLDIAVSQPIAPSTDAVGFTANAALAARALPGISTDSASIDASDEEDEGFISLPPTYYHTLQSRNAPAQEPVADDLSFIAEALSRRTLFPSDDYAVLDDDEERLSSETTLRKRTSVDDLEAELLTQQLKYSGALKGLSALNAKQRGGTALTEDDLAEKTRLNQAVSDSFIAQTKADRELRKLSRLSVPVENEGSPKPV